MNIGPESFQGVIPILVSPFNEDASLDLDSLERVVGFMADLGVNGVTVLGVLGEANRMVDADREAIIKCAVDAAGRMPVVVGASHSGTGACLELCKMAQRLGASAVMITPQKEPVPNPERIVELFKTVGRGVELPIIVQDHPASTGVHMPVPLLLRIMEEVPGVACIKEEATPTPQKLSALFGGMKGRKVPVLVGLGALYGLFDLERGADGFNTGFAFPEVLMALVKAAKAGDWKRVRGLYTRFLPLIVFEQQPGLAVRKEIYRLRGLISHNRVRHPGATIDKTTSGQLQGLLEHTLPGVDLTKPIAI